MFLGTVRDVKVAEEVAPAVALETTVPASVLLMGGGKSYCVKLGSAAAAARDRGEGD